MFEITLMKSLYHEMDQERIPEVEAFTDGGDASYRRLPLKLPEYPGLKSMTSEVRHMAYGVAMYYLHLNDNLKVDEDIDSPLAKAAILHFFSTYQPSFFKKDLPGDLSRLSVLDCFDVDRIPDYRPKYAFPGLVTLEDIRNGKVKEKDMPTFPGIRMLRQGIGENGDETPAFVSEQEEYTRFHGDPDKVMDKLEELKQKFKVEQ